MELGEGIILTGRKDRIMNDKIQDIIYIKSESNKCRYALGIRGRKPLIFFGINPSTATPDGYDQTMKKAKGFACKNNFDSWIMLNIYPQRAINPDSLDNKKDEKNHKDNLEIIKKIINKKATIVTTWGDLINEREYLILCLKDIIKILKNKNIKWFCIGKLSNIGNPRHILRLGYEEKLIKFDIENYIKKIIDKR